MNFGGIGQALIGNHLKVQLFQIFQRFPVALEGHALCQLDIKNQNIQLPLGGDFGVLLAQGTGGGISGIGKGFFAVFFQCFVQTAEGFLGHEHLAPDDQTLRRVLKSHGDGANGPQILGHILTHDSVASGRPPDKLAVYILQGHGQPVNFGLYRELGTRYGVPDTA